ncbi:hypothetical protein BD770DRAFT_443126 [Pilaira anomala]|nr:hypothetical protein BD770DRAFT_443126 [Pilaira anomala]
MKLAIISALSLIASVIAQTNTTLPNNGMGGTVATASITVDSPRHENAGSKFNENMVIVSLISITTSVYAYI